MLYDINCEAKAIIINDFVNNYLLSLVFAGFFIATVSLHV